MDDFDALISSPEVLPKMVNCCAHIVNLIVCAGLKDIDDLVVKIGNAVRFV